MKKYIAFNNFKSGSYINKYYWFSFFLLITIIFQPFRCNAQIKPISNNGFGLTLDTYVSGNAHGTMYSGLLNYRINRSVISLGPSIQKRYMKIGGGKLTYSYLLNAPKTKKRYSFHTNKNKRNINKYIDEELDDEEEIFTDDGFQIKFYSYFQYLNNLPLSYDAQKLESFVNRVENQNWNSTTLSTVEGGLGFELNIRITRNLYWRNFIAASVFYHTKYVTNMQHEQYSPALTIGTSLNIPNFK